MVPGRSTGRGAGPRAEVLGQEQMITERSVFRHRHRLDGGCIDRPHQWEGFCMWTNDDKKLLPSIEIKAADKALVTVCSA